jgi:peptidoglycan/LPS O-acetylase OafA/YrhL
MKLQTTAYLEGGTAARFVLACIVVFSHLGTLPFLYRNSKLLDADFAVQCFFILSGYAMMNNYQKFVGVPGGIMGFLTQRFFRIVVTVFLLIVVQIVGLSFVANCSFKDYVGLPLLKYFLANITLLNFLQQQIPCVFTELKSAVVNGSLWTMKVEMGFYLLFPLLFVIIRKRAIWLLALIIGSLAFRLLAEKYFDVLIYQLPSQIMYFGIGMALYKYHQSWFGSRLVTIVGILLFIKNAIWHYSIPETLITFPLILLAFSNLLAFTDKYIKRHDYSFTIYLVHWPLIKVADLYFFSKGNIAVGYIVFFASLVLSCWLFKKLAEDKALQWGKSMAASIMQNARQKKAMASATVSM